MSTKKENKTVTHDPELEKLWSSPSNPDFVEIARDRYVWKAGVHPYPVQGYILEALDFPEKGGMKAWTALVVQLTKPTIANDDDKNPVRCEPGDEVIIACTHSLSPLLGKALDPEFAVEVIVRAREKKDIGGGKSVWRFYLQANPKSIRKKAELAPHIGALALLTEPTTAMPALPAKSE